MTTRPATPDEKDAIVALANELLAQMSKRNANVGLAALAFASAAGHIVGMYADQPLVAMQSIASTMVQAFNQAHAKRCEGDVQTSAPGGQA